MVDDGKEPQAIENLALLMKEKQGLFSGIIKVFLVSCTNLVKADSGKNELSDPYVVFKVLRPSKFLFCLGTRR